ncbi:MAG: DUF1566 domain-containing protein [Candidatus Eisenbacteria bacterium]
MRFMLIIPMLFVASPYSGLYAQCTLPATGATQCSDENGWAPCPVLGFPGQDAETAYNQLSYTLVSAVPGQETVIDNNTGLEWTQISFPDMSWQEALQFCDTLNWGGKDDWRLPNVKELQSIVDYGRFNPPIDPIFICPADLFWTSTTASLWVLDGRTAYAADAVGFGAGHLGQRSKWEENCVRPVRGCPGGFGCSLPATGQHDCFDNDSSEPCPVEGFPNQDAENIYNDMTYSLDSSVPGEETILDGITGLEWSQHVWEEVTWQEALRLCDTLHWGGHDDWRMPNLKELQSIALYQGWEIPDIFGDAWWWEFWSSTTYAPVPDYAWVHGYTEWGQYEGGSKTNGNHDVRPVRWCGESPTSTERSSWGSLKKMFR